MEELATFDNNFILPSLSSEETSAMRSLPTT